MRILIATVTAGGGHLQAAAALEEAWKTTYPSDDVKRVDLLDLVPKMQRKFYADGYVKLVEHAPELYGLFCANVSNGEMWCAQMHRHSSAFAACCVVTAVVLFVVALLSAVGVRLDRLFLLRPQGPWRVRSSQARGDSP